ncbi:hypothetical protein [Methanobacterium sp.]|uniref:hypothetical protein n=1 Tax=Methanobacterium sp. TaxID=2164 RepID=UPI003159252F
MYKLLRVVPGKMTARIAWQKKYGESKKAECEIMEMDLNKSKNSELDKKLKKCFNKRNNNKYLITGVF